MPELIEDLRGLIAGKQAVAIVGSGVSRAATGDVATASWKGLLERGIQHCKTAAGVTDRWCLRQKEALHDAIDEGDLVELLAVAEQIRERLNAPKGGEFARWLEESLNAKALPLQERRLIQALDALQIPIVTTNYDDLIERATGRPGVTWRDTYKIPRILRGEDNSVLHLHGKWDAAESVILGIRDYQSVASDEHTQAVMQALGFTCSLLFVGCGEGLKDPNFANFLRWLSRVRSTHADRNYRLALESEVATLQKQHPPDQRVFVLSYGQRHSDLTAFLESLRPQPTLAASNPPAAAPRSAELDAYIRQLCDRSRRLQLIGLAASLQVDLPIADAYVPLRTCCAPDRRGRGRFDLQRRQVTPIVSGRGSTAAGTVADQAAKSERDGIAEGESKTCQIAASTLPPVPCRPSGRSGPGKVLRRAPATVKGRVGLREG